MRITVDEAADFFDKTPQTIYKRIRNGSLKAIVLQVGRRKYYELTLEALIEPYKGQLSRLEAEQRLQEIRGCNCRTSSENEEKENE